MRLLNSLLSFTAASFFLTGCVHGPTPYFGDSGPNAKIKPAGDDLLTSNFMGNPQTGKNRTHIYSNLGAVEYCEKENKYAFIVGIKDFSKSAQYMESYTSTVPIVNRSGQMVSAVSNTSTYPVTVTTPDHMTFFMCLKKLKGLQGKPRFETLSKELVSPLTNDFRGGLLVKSAGENKDLKEGDVILEVEGKRVDNSFAFVREVSLQGDKLSLKVLRGKKPKTIKTTTRDESDFLKSSKKDIITHACAENQDDGEALPWCKKTEAE